MAETAVQASAAGLAVGGCLSHRAINQPHWSFPLPNSPSNWQTNSDSSIVSHKALWHPITPFDYELFKNCLLGAWFLDERPKEKSNKSIGLEGIDKVTLELVGIHETR